MRSTRQFLNTPFKADSRHLKDRVKAIEEFKQAQGQAALTIPDEYLDYFYHTVMQHPVDLSICDDERIIVDLKTVSEFRDSGKGHPLNRQPLKPMVRKNPDDAWSEFVEPYMLDQNLAQRIAAFVAIEELKLYVAACEEARQSALYKALDGKSDEETNKILALQDAVNTLDIAAVYGYAPHTIPEKFYGHAPCRTVMTLPVILDGKYSIDFFELLKTLPDNHELSAEELAEREEKAKAYKEAKIANIERERDEQLASVKPVSEEFPEEMRARHINCIHAMHSHRVNGLQGMSSASLFPTEAEEYINPFTGMPITSIEVNYALLNEIDCFLDPFEHQMPAVEAMAARQQKAMNKHLDQKIHGKSYAQILVDEAHPANKIPESLALGRIPGKDQLELMTHPVLLDGEYLIDLQRLQEFWKPASGLFFGRAGCRGINPFTNQPIKTISYDADLKDSTDRFFLNRHAFKGLLNEKTVRDASFLRNKTSTFHTFHGSALKRPGLAGLVTEAASTPSNTNGKN